MKHYSLFQCQLLASGLQVEFRKAPLLHPFPYSLHLSSCVTLGGTWTERSWSVLGEQTHAWLWLPGCCKMEPCCSGGRALHRHS